MAGEITISGGYPHELLGHLRRLDGADDINFFADSARLLDEYCHKYSDYSHGIRELEVAIKLGVIDEMIEIFSEPMWRKRAFINKTAIRMMAEGELKEHEMVELIESFAQLFGWDIEMTLARRWETSEEDSAEWYKANHSRVVHSRSEAGGEYSITESGKDPSDVPANDECIKDNEVDNDIQYDTVAVTQVSTVSSRNNLQAKHNHIEPQVSTQTDSSIYVDEYELMRIDSLFERMTPKEFIANEILKSGLKYEMLMSNSVRKEARKAVNGNVDSQLRMGQFYAEPDTKHTDYAEAVKWYKLSASQGNDKAQFELGMLYDSGKIKCDDYKQKAMKCYLSLAESGFPTAQCTIGLKYRFGDGVEENLDEAIKWLKRSAYQGHVDAQRNLGDIYSGIGNKEEALKWYSRAAALGDVYSEKRIR